MGAKNARLELFTVRNGRASDVDPPQLSRRTTSHGRVESGGARDAPHGSRCTTGPPPGGSAHCAPRSSAPRAVDGHSPRGLDGTAIEVRCDADLGPSLHFWSAPGCLKPVPDAGGAARTLSGEEPPRARRRWWSACGRPQGRGQVGCPQSAPVGRHVTRHMILNPHMGSSARPSAVRAVPRASCNISGNDSFKVRGWPERR